MKQNTSYDLKNKECLRASCRSCANCKAINFDDKKPGFKTAPSQLYAKEIENYFFYYDLRIKQG